MTRRGQERQAVNRRWQAAVAVVLLVLAACTPGAQLENSNYTVIPITPEVIAQQRVHREQTHAEAASPTRAVAPHAAAHSYRIGAGDVLSFRLWDAMGMADPAAATMAAQALSIKVEEDGGASFPLIGTVAARGKTTGELRAEVSKRLQGYFKAPRFDLQVQEFHSSAVTVSGAVVKPGVQYLGYEPLTASRAVELAGGAQTYADLGAVTLVHADGQRELLDLLALSERADQSQQRVLAAGDTLLLNENHRNRVFLMGEAVKPGALYIKAGKLSLTEALNDPQSPAHDAQGPNTQAASIGNIYVIRGALGDGAAPDPATVRIYRLDTSTPVAYALGDRFMLEPRDVIYISPAMVTEWHRFISQILPSNFGITKGID